MKKILTILIAISCQFAYSQEILLPEINPNDMLQHQDRYQSKLTYVVGSLASYTKLGIAALLPHKKLSYESNSGYIYINEINLSVTDNRTKILQKYVQKSICIKAEDF